MGESERGRAMTRAKANLAKTRERLHGYKFDTAGYVVLDTGISRDSATGRLVVRKPSKESGKSGK